MLKILENRQNELQRKCDQLIARGETNSKWKESPEYLQACLELEGQLAFYSDYELIQNADESNIKERLKELANEAWDDAFAVMGDCDACLVEYKGADINRCKRCANDGDVVRLLAVRDEAFDVLALLEDEVAELQGKRP